MDEDPLGGQLLVLAVLVALNAFFASSEVALISLKQSTVRRLAESGGKRGRRLASLVGNSGRFLATVQIGVTLAGFLASAFAADSFAAPLTDWFLAHGVTFLRRSSLEAVVVVAITILLSYVSLVFGELVPKQLGLRYSEKIALWVSGPIHFLARVSAPVVWFLNASVNLVMCLFGKADGNEQSVTEEEIRILVDMGEENGAIQSDEKRMIQNVFEFNNKAACDLMTHRRDVVALNADASPEEIEQTLLASGYSRIPVFCETIDNIIGILHFREYFMAKLSGREIDLRKLVHPAYLVPENMMADRLLRDIQKEKVAMAVLLDEFGGTSGIVTVEDLLEEIVGGIYDEYDESEEDFTVLSADSWRLRGTMRLDESAKLIGIEIPGDPYNTISGEIMNQLNAVPSVGDRIQFPGLDLTVETIVARHVGTVIVKRLPGVDSTEIACRD